jgi:serine kinase of HPr protein (carbohydrate metabolism regulator)
MTGPGPLHATVVAHHGPAGWRGLLIAGPSGAGKSDLALRLIGRGWRLVADDYCHVWASDGGLYATAPQTIRGRIEARGLGILDRPERATVRLALGLDCVCGPVERLPEPRTRALAGIDLPWIVLDPRPASAVELVAAAIDTL